MTKLENKVLCSHIAVDCVENDKQDIKMGGPQFIDYDFYVKNEETQEMIGFIKSVIEETGTPLLNVYKAGTVEKTEDKVWTKDRIHKCISNNEAGIDKHLFTEPSKNL